MDEPNITALLHEVNKGDAHALEQLIAALYSELRRLSASLMRREAAGHTLQPTALVNEAFLRLTRGETQWANRAHFFGAAARAMRQILIEHARSRAAQKRGGAVQRVTFEDLAVTVQENQLDILLLDEALKALEAKDPRLAQVVELRFFGGFGIEETAELLGISGATVKRDWLYARAWLFAYIESGEAHA